MTAEKWDNITFAQGIHFTVFPSFHVFQVTDPIIIYQIEKIIIKCVGWKSRRSVYFAPLFDIAIKKVNIGLAKRGAAAVSALRV